MQEGVSSLPVRSLFGTVHLFEIHFSHPGGNPLAFVAKICQSLCTRA